jgi:hypothetical protein
MSSSDAGGYSGIKTVSFTIGVAFLILASLYVARCCTGLSLQQIFSRNRFRGSSTAHHDFSGFSFDRGIQTTVEMEDEPNILDVWISSWYPLCSLPESQLERPGIVQAQDDGQERDPDPSTTDHQKRSLWASFLVG